MVDAQLLPDIGGESTGFRSEQQGIPRLVLYFMIEALALGGEPEQATFGITAAEFIQAGMTLYRGELVIVQPRPAQALVFPDKPQGLDQVKLKAGVGAKPDDVAGVRGDFRLVKDDVQHGWLAGSWARCERGSFSPLPRRERGRLVPSAQWPGQHPCRHRYRGWPDLCGHPA